ncbi:MAG TPA: hypothetical protein PLV87_14660, partial [Opitutaceae bacterium]|nr:hypothetical protein [Opitutaceae bacterium]
LPGAVEQPVTFRVAKVPKSPAIKLRDATPLDVARIRGDWERLQISFVRKAFPDVVDKYVEQARKTLRKPYDQGDSLGCSTVIPVTERPRLRSWRRPSRPRSCDRGSTTNSRSIAMKARRKAQQTAS